MNDKILKTQFCGMLDSDLSDQYADGKAAKLWELYLGSKQERTSIYREWFTSLLRNRKVQKVLDVACGTGVDSVMLLEEGFTVVSTDASDQMLKVALRERWNRRKEDVFDKWIIEEANWISLQHDLESLGNREALPSSGFDAIICLGNSFSNLLDMSGHQLKHKKALSNMRDVLKVGGLLVIDHRNFDHILRTGVAPQGKNIYYPCDHIKKIKTSKVYVEGQPIKITFDYTMDITATMTEQQLSNLSELTEEEQMKLKFQNFRISNYPHTLEAFNQLITEVFGDVKHEIFGDFKSLIEIQEPAYYIHVITKTFK